ncbi:hypothetical protein K9N68_10560 [Kovacikia minuta CCNUW1]|uniref:hypothetical protein n=1 Tax=Kovacikia minuta TaxID=2931930 RepID=UPI001CCDC218|nr:hypothetical protein [Kovacikia minuta]UBF28275.1 hypothetical protein K9N68_10560 [Kovacikia minuta CCNUW1]
MTFHQWVGLQVKKQVWLLTLATILHLLMIPFVAIQVRAQTPNSKTPDPPQQPLRPAANPWQPDDFQRAMVLGTTMPNEMPMPVVPLGSPQGIDNTLPAIEEIPPLFKKPLPIISPAKPPATKP